ncbi:T9SS type A sorting domain-containing protein [Taibaiella koreensis]|uniref:T9SS type A sorting domain-containing protein n=1 Tax=Taibaiella koreensis TaxID=1268548 RepID=UPI000E59952F|nr:T9SS type A sorting domain-containing protein [Taibaiella koreensis]
MRKLYLSLLWLLCYSLQDLAPARAQAVNFSWARGIDNPDGNAAYMNAMLNKDHVTTVDSMGNVYTAGRFFGTVDFDPGPGVVNLSATGIRSSIYITKINAAGNLVWAKSLRTTTGYGASATVITIDKKGAVYVAGRLNDTSTIDYDPGPGTQIGTNADNNSLFIVKLDGSGGYVWAKQFDGALGGVSLNSLNYLKGLAVDDAGNVYFAGQFNGGIDLDPGPGTAMYTVANPCSNCMNAFVAKLDASGNFLWGGDMYCDAECGVESLAIDAQANIYFTGGYFGTLDLDPGPGTYNSVNSLGGYIVKLNTNGVFQWAHEVQSTGRVWCQDIVTDVTGNILVTGGFYGTVDFNLDPGPANVFNVTGLNAGSSSGIPYYAAYDGYVLKLDPGGHFIWVRSYGGVITNTYMNATLDNGRGLSIATDKTGAVYAMGTFIETADFDPGPGTFNLTAVPDSADIYLLKLSAAGDFEWAKDIRNQFLEVPTYKALCPDISVDDRGDVYASSAFKNTVDFDPGPGVSNLTAIVPCSNFIVKLSPVCPIASRVSRDSSCGPYTFNGQVYTTSGSYSQFYTSSGGCDSVSVLHLVIRGDTVQLADTGCKQYVLNSNTYTESGVYTQIYTNTAGCDSVLVLNLLVNKPDTSVSLSGRMLSALSTDGDHYRWIDCNDNSPVPGATTQQFTPVEDGSYALVITVGGCSDTSACYQVGAGTSIRTPSGNRVKLYPNPVKDVLFIEAAQVLDHASLRLTDIMGKTVLLQQQLSGRSFRISTAGLPPGIYFVELAEGSRASKAKLVKY